MVDVCGWLEVLPIFMTETDLGQFLAFQDYWHKWEENQRNTIIVHVNPLAVK